MSSPAGTSSATTRAPWACPGCAAPIDRPVAACPTCGLRLVGPEADELRAVLAESARLRTRAAELVEALRGPAASAVGTAPASPAARPAPAADPDPRLLQRIGVQQVLYGLGALLLLAGASVFVLAVWFIVGLPGQVVIMGAATAGAFAAARATAHRGLAGASETAGVLGVGLTVIDVAAAYSLDLAGVGSLASTTWTALGSLVVLGVTVLAHLEQRRPSEASRRPVAVYLPAAVLAWAAAVLAVVARIDPAGLAAVGVLTAASLALAVAADVARRARARLPGEAAPHGVLLRRSATAAAVLAGIGAAVAAALAVLTDLETAFDLEGTDRPTRELAGLLLLGAALGAWPVVSRRLPAASRGRAAMLTTLAAVVGCAALVTDVPRVGVAVGGVVLAALAVESLLLAPLRAPGGPLARALLAAQRGSVAAAALLVLWLSAVQADSVTDLARHGQVAGPLAAGWVLAAWTALLLTAVAGAARSPGRGRAAWSLAIGPVWLVLSLQLALDAVHGPGRPWVLLATLVVALGAGALAALRRWLRVEAGLVLADLVLVPVTLAHAVGGDGPGSGSTRLAVALLAMGIALVTYAAVPGRLGVAYPGVLAIAAAGWVVTGEAGIEAVEAYSLPLAALLLGIGAVHRRRRTRGGGRPLPSALSLGPGLGVALLPSVVVALGSDDVVRAALVAAAGLGYVALGARARLLAPLLHGVLGLGVLALDRGGPYLAALPTWVVLTTAGVVVLALAVRWEQAVASGRRAGTWVGHLR